MKKVRCPYCGFASWKYGKTSAGSRRWKCQKCHRVFTLRIDREVKNLVLFLDWLFSKVVQKEMAGEGRNFRRKTAKYWEIWAMPPKIEEHKEVLFVDGLYIGRKACILICCDEEHVLGWYLCRREKAASWEALLSRIAEPHIVVSDGGPGFRKALKKVWPNAKPQRCLFHVFSQIRRYTTANPRTPADAQLYMIARDLMSVETLDQAVAWIKRFKDWKEKYKRFLAETTRDEYGRIRYTHERLVKARNSLNHLIKSETLFTYLKEAKDIPSPYPRTNNRIEGGVNAQIRAMLRNHRGLSVERRIKAAFWWCYFHTAKPLPFSEILKVMPTNKSISDIYNSMNEQEKLSASVPGWGQAIMWGELHKSEFNYSHEWD